MGLSRRLSPHLCAVTLLTGTLSGAALAAPPSDPSADPGYSGAFRAVELSGGLDGALDLAGRLSLPLHLADFVGGYTVDDGHRVYGEARLHPTFFFLLAGGYWGPTLGAPYVGAGVVGALTDGGGLSWRWSVGTDVPLLDPQRAWGLWLGTRYQSRRPISGPGAGPVDRAVMITLGLRWHGW